MLIGVDTHDDGVLNKADGDLIVGDTLQTTDLDNANLFIGWESYEYGDEKEWPSGKGVETIELILDGEPLDPIGVFPPDKGHLYYSLPRLEPGNHYLRAQCTSYEFTNNSGFTDQYRAITNPLWIVSQPGKRVFFEDDFSDALDSTNGPPSMVRKERPGVTSGRSVVWKGPASGSGLRLSPAKE